MDREELFTLYVTKKLNPYQIATQLGCNHKTIRAYLRKFDVPIRSASEYNFLARASHSEPSEENLLSKKSIAAHIAYLCEGCHSAKARNFGFCNQDPVLIDLILWLLSEVYSYTKKPYIVVCGPDKDSAKHFLDLYPESSFQLDKQRKNPIIRVRAGGKNLVRLVTSNAYKLLSTLS